VHVGPIEQTACLPIARAKFQDFGLFSDFLASAASDF